MKFSLAPSSARLSVAAIVALAFGVCSGIAIAAVGQFAHVFANELGIQSWVFVAVPALRFNPPGTRHPRQCAPSRG